MLQQAYLSAMPKRMYCFQFISPDTSMVIQRRQLLCVHNDIVSAVDEKWIVALMLLDVSAV